MSNPLEEAIRRVQDDIASGYVSGVLDKGVLDKLTSRVLIEAWYGSTTPSSTVWHDVRRALGDAVTKGNWKTTPLPSRVFEEADASVPRGPPVGRGFEEDVDPVEMSADDDRYHAMVARSRAAAQRVGGQEASNLREESLYEGALGERGKEGETRDRDGVRSSAAHERIKTYREPSPGTWMTGRPWYDWKRSRWIAPVEGGGQWEDPTQDPPRRSLP